MRFYCLLLLCLQTLLALSQQSITKKTLPVELSRYRFENYSDQALSNISDKINLPAEFQLNNVHIVDNRIILTEKGTGRILIIDSSGSTVRADATKYGGDRFGAFEFVFRDTLYSIGGYGFWHVNGAVRKFDWITRDWTPVTTNKNIPAALGVNAYFHFISDKGKVFVLFEHYPDEYLIRPKSKEKRVNMAIFNTYTKQWEEPIYIISPTLMNEVSDIRAIAHTNQTLIIHTRLNTQTIELDFIQNHHYLLADDFLNKFYSITGQKNTWMTKSEGTSIFIGKLSDTQLQQLDVKQYRYEKRAEFYKPDTKVNKPSEKNLIAIFSIGLNVLLLFTGCFLLYKRYKVKSTVLNTIEQTQISQHKLFTELLDELEITIIEKIWLNSKSGESTSIDEINKLLGIDKRPYKIQNNLRADALKLINKKFNDFINTKDELIIRKRSDFDKRYFTYHINERYINKIIIRKND